MITTEELSRLTHIPLKTLQGAMRQKGIPEEKKKITPEESRSILDGLSLSFKQKSITIAALKGGIGKTFLSSNLAIRLSMMGARVLIVDLDPEACATNSLLSQEQVESEEKKTILEVCKNLCTFEEAIWPTKYPLLDIMPSSLRVAKTERIVNLKNPKTLLRKSIEQCSYDFVFFELPPSFSTLSAAAYLASDEIIIPCTPNIHSLESVDLTVEAISEVAQEFECHHLEFKIILNMFNPKRTASQDTLTILRDEHADLLLPFCIPESADIQNAINSGLSVFEHRSKPQVREAIDLLVGSICSLKIGERSPHTSIPLTIPLEGDKSATEISATLQ